MISIEQAESAVNLLVEYAQQIRDSVSIYRDDEGIPMAIVTACSHCAKLFDEFAKLSDDEKQKALQRAETPVQRNTA